MTDLYMKRLQDLEYPLDEDSPVLLGPRPNINNKNNLIEADNEAPKTISAPLTEEEKKNLRY